MNAKQAEARIDLHWWRFAGKMVLALHWIILAAVVGDELFDPGNTSVVRLILASVVTVPTALWIWSVQRRLLRRDEYEAKLAFSGLAAGASYALLFGVLVLLVGAVLEAVGLATPGSALENAPNIVTLPPLGWAMGEAFVQMTRVRMSKADKPR